MMRMARSLLANLATLLLSFALALVIWINAMQIEDPTIKRALQIPAIFIGIPENVTRIMPADDNLTVLITYEGPSSIVSTLSQDDFSAIIDLSNTPLSEEVVVPIDIQSKNTQVLLETPIPESVTVQLEKLVTRAIDVELEVRGEVARGHTMGEPLVDPAVIFVTGTESDVERLDFARVTVFLNNDTQARIESPQPLFYNRQGRVASVSSLQLSSDQVRVTIPVNESADFANKVITADIVGQVAPGYRVLGVTIEPPSVLVTGRPTQLAQPFRVETERIDITGLTETFEDKVSLVLPDGIMLDSVTEITVSVQIEPFSSTKIYNQSIELLGVNEALETTINPETVRIVLFGPSPILDTLTEQEVRVSVDLFGLGPGEYLLEPDVDIPDRGLELRSIQPSVIEVIIFEPITSADEFTEIKPLILNVIDQPPRIKDLITAVSNPTISTHFAWLPKNRAF